MTTLAKQYDAAGGRGRPFPEILARRVVDTVPLELAGDHIAEWNSFLDTETLFPMFGLPRQLPA